jgi:hypothetical protein
VLKVSSSDKRKHKILSAKAGIIKKFDKGEKLIKLLNVLRYMISRRIEKLN